MRRSIRFFSFAVIAAVVSPFTLIPEADAAFPGGNGDIAFSRARQGQCDIWIIHPGDTGTENLTNTPRTRFDLMEALPSR
jgi:hypothetical protein